MIFGGIEIMFYAIACGGVPELENVRFEWVLQYTWENQNFNASTGI